MIKILMATYNGEKYLQEQLDSLLNQTFQDFIIYINDDCSSDNTFEIARAYAEKYSGKFVVSRNSSNSGSPKFNFINMMLENKDNYIMLCDQDDIWLEDKIKISLDEMRRLEKLYGENTPILVHTDLIVVSGDLEQINSSFKKMIGTPEIDSLKIMALQNDLTGCTAIYNKALADLIRPINGFYVMHDWWLAYIAFCFGKPVFLDKATLYYRIHENNIIGGEDIHALKYKINKILGYNKIKKALFEAYKQAGTFLDTYQDLLNPDQKEILAACSSLRHKNKTGRIFTMARKNLFRKGLLRKLSQIFFG